MARQLAGAALGHVAREYPNKLDHVMGGVDDVLSPRTLHPCFFGSYDWHSCVHGWWTLLTLRRLFPDTEEAQAIADLAGKILTEENLAVELTYARRPSSRGFERPYGWGWLLYLHHEAARHQDREWGTLLEPLARHFAAALKDYLKLLTYPITVGTHYNTAFALVLAREWAEARDPDLLALIDEWGLRAFADRAAYRGWEPGGDEFLSPVLTAAMFMSRVMPHAQFASWFDRLVLNNGWLENECRPAVVSDRSDGKIAHLDGLNLSRAWCLRMIAPNLGDHPSSGAIERIADQHFDAAINHVVGDYMGEHWLASFALLALLAGREPG